MLAKDIMFYSHKHLIDPLFSRYESENLLRDITYELKNLIFMPGDIIYKRKEKCRDVYFIVEGTVEILNNKNERIAKLKGNMYFGDAGLYG